MTTEEPKKNYVTIQASVSITVFFEKKIRVSPHELPEIEQDADEWARSQVEDCWLGEVEKADIPDDIDIESVKLDGKELL